MEEAGAAIALQFNREGAAPTFKNCIFNVHAGNKVLTTEGNVDEEGNVEVDEQQYQQEIEMINLGGDPRIANEEQQHCFLNDIWMHVEDAQIISFFCKDQDSLDKMREYLEADHKRIILLPEEIFAHVGGMLQAKFESISPPEFTITISGDDKLKITAAAARRRWHKMYFHPNPHPDHLKHPKPYQVSYKTEVFDHENQPMEGGFEAQLKFSWPLIPRTQDEGAGASQGPSTSGLQDRTTQDLSAEMRSHCQALLSWSVPEFALRQACSGKAWKVQLESSDGDSLELDGCKVQFQPEAGDKNSEVQIFVDGNSDSVNLLDAAISRALKFKPSKFEKAVHVSLRSWLTPKPGEEIRVKIMSKKGDADWEKIQEVPVKNGNTIKYEVMHFCWHVAVVSEEEEKKGEYHLLNDIWMHKETGIILSLFWKDEIFLKKGSRALEADYKRIISIPDEVIVSIGSTIQVKLECNGPEGMEIVCSGFAGPQVKITHKAMKKNFLSLMFQPKLSSANLQSTGSFRVFYHASVIDFENQPVEGGFSAPLHYKLPRELSRLPRQYGKVQAPGKIQERTENPMLRKRKNLSLKHDKSTRRRSPKEVPSGAVAAQSEVDRGLPRWRDGRTQVNIISDTRMEHLEARSLSKRNNLSLKHDDVISKHSKHFPQPKISQPRSPKEVQSGAVAHQSEADRGSFKPNF